MLFEDAQQPPEVLGEAGAQRAKLAGERIRQYDLLLSAIVVLHDQGRGQQPQKRHGRAHLDDHHALEQHVLFDSSSGTVTASPCTRSRCTYGQTRLCVIVQELQKDRSRLRDGQRGVLELLAGADVDSGEICSAEIMECGCERLDDESGIPSLVAHDRQPCCP